MTTLKTHIILFLAKTCVTLCRNYTLLEPVKRKPKVPKMCKGDRKDKR